MKTVMAMALSAVALVAGAISEEEVEELRKNDKRPMALQKLKPIGRKGTKAEFLRKTGGRCEGRTKGGCYLFLDCTKDGRLDFKETMRQMGLGYEIVTEVEEATLAGTPLAFAREALNKRKDVSAVTVIYDGSLDEPIETVYPMDKVSVINAGPLKSAPADKYGRRLRSLMWRAVAFTAGAAMPFGVDGSMKNVFTVKGLDDLPCEYAHPMSAQLVSANAEEFNFARYRKGSYKTACIEGWAPAPTNDIQKAIWDEVHAIPQKPIKIEYNEKRDKGK